MLILQGPSGCFTAHDERAVVRAAWILLLCLFGLYQPGTRAATCIRPVINLSEHYSPLTMKELNLYSCSSELLRIKSVLRTPSSLPSHGL